MPFTLPKLPYDFNALEPYLDVQTMEIHYSKHHQGYLDKLNAALEKNPEFFEKSIEEILSNLDSVPEDIRSSVRNAGGGYFHHTFYWNIMKKDGGGEPGGEILETINSKFGSFSVFKEKFSGEAGKVFGSGWTWLVKDKNGEISVVSTPNQDSPLSKGLIPLLCIDVWEHAYYLKYQNRRTEFIDAWWNVVNWEKVEQNFLS